MATKVYRYGCMEPTIEERALIDEQLFLAHRYRVMLWHLAAASRAQYRQRRLEHFPELERVEAEVARLSELFGLLDPKGDRAMRREIKIEIQRLKARAKELRQVAKECTAFAADVAADREREGVLQRALRAVFSSWGLYSGTYLCVEDAALRARKGIDDPAEPRWDGSGVLGIQLQGGRTAADIASGRDPSIHIVPPQRAGKGHRAGSRSVARYRVCSRERKPVCITLRCMVDRDLPSDAKVTWAKLVVSRSGACSRGTPRYAYSLQLTVESEANARREFGAGTVAVCFQNDVVTYADDGDGVERTFDVTSYCPRLSGRKIQDLQSIRDKNRNHALGLIRGWCERQEETPEWLLEEIESCLNARSCRRTVRLVERIADMVDNDLLKALREWVYHENHLWQWQADARQNELRARKDAYRRFAADLRRKYRHVLIDSRRLDAPERKTAERNQLGLHELRLAIRHSFGPEYAHEVTGLSCAEMFERFGDAKERAAE